MDGVVIRLDPTTEPRLGRRKIVIPRGIVETGGRTLLPPPKSSGLDEHEDFSLASRRWYSLFDSR